MLFPATKVQWMDIDKQEVKTEDLLWMYSMYSEKARRITEAVSEITFNADTYLNINNTGELPVRHKGAPFVDGVVKITDWFGWTDIRVIRRIDKILKWTMVRAGGHQVKMAEDTLIPIYNPGVEIQGFHGEIKYPFTVIALRDIKGDGSEFVKVRRGRGEDGEKIEFAPLQIDGREGPHPDNIGYHHAYQILTRSGFFNAGNLYLWGRESIPSDYCQVCPNEGTQNCAGCRR